MQIHGLKGLFAGWLVLMLSALPVAAQDDASGKRWALIVGVSDYQSIGPRLSGPRNDVTLITTTLQEAGFARQRMRLLADGLEESSVEPKVTADGEPTREAILAGFDWLAESAGPGSEVMIYLSGHGSQAPAARSGDESDGLDELFLPIDAKKAAAGERSIPNAIADNEFRAKLRAILNTRATVWFVVDSCNSGTLSRAGETLRTARFVDPESLGIARGMMRVEAGGSELQGEAATDGVFNFGQSDDFVGFYAALPSQLAYESKAQFGLPGTERSIIGEFTWSLVTAIRAGGLADYEELGRQIVATYAQGARSNTVAMFEGDLLKSPMVGSGAGGKTFALKSVGGELFAMAGGLDGLSGDAILELNDRTSGSIPLGRARVSSAGLSEARLEIVDTTESGNAIVASAKAGVRTDLARLSARLVAHDPSFVLQIAKPALLPNSKAAPGDQTLLANVTRWIDALLTVSPESQQVAMQLVGPDEPADIYPYVSGGRVWFFKRGADLSLRGAGDPYGLDAADLTSETLGTTLRKFGKHSNLMRVADAISRTETSNALDVRLFVVPASTNANGGEPCSVLEGPDDAPEQIGGPPEGALEYNWRTTPPVVENCDYVYIEILNKGHVALDVSSFYVDAWANVSFLWTYKGGSEGEGMRLQPGQRRMVYYPEILGPPNQRQAVGPMQLLIIAVPSATGTDRPVGFKRLELPEQRTRSADQLADGFGATLERAGFGDGGTRNAGAIATASSGGALIIPIVTRAR